jgi:hypothetical protein
MKSEMLLYKYQQLDHLNPIYTLTANFFKPFTVV